MADCLAMPTSTQSAADTAIAVRAAQAPDGAVPQPQTLPPVPVEVGGRAGPEPTRFGDWEKSGRCIDF
jgi:hypothetical protein